jgi:hypothetical protein
MGYTATPKSRMKITEPLGDDELDFIINYDIKYRLGNDLFDDQDNKDE